MDAIGRLTRLMELLMEDGGELGIREIAQRVSVPRSTVQRMLDSLEACGWLIQDTKTQRYRVALRLLLFSNEWRLYQELVRQSREVMLDLCHATYQTILLLRLEGQQGICLNRVEPERTIRLVAETGKRFPLHAAACGKILLAYSPPDLQERVLSSPLESFTTHTITDPNLLREELSRIRERGHAYSQEEMTVGAAEVAVPLLFRNSGSLVAALSIAGPAFDLAGRFEDFARLLKESREKIPGLKEVN